MNHVYYSDTQYHDIAQKTKMLIDEAEKLPESYSREIIFMLLENFDMLHREALSRLLMIIEEKYPELRPAMEGDFAVQSLFALYDLFEDGLVSRKEGPIQTGQLRPDPSPGSVNDIGNRIRMPIWIPAGNKNELAPGKIYYKEFEMVKILFCHVGDELFAFESNCPGSVLSLEFGRIEDNNLICPWHGCIFDLHTGIKAGDISVKLKRYPLNVREDGSFMIGFNI